MLEIIEVRIGEERNKILAHYALAESKSLHVTRAMQDDEARGCAIYAYVSEETVLYVVDDDGDLALCDGLVRSVMLKTVLRGLDTLRFEIEDERMLAHLDSLGFIRNSQKSLSKLMDIMENCKKCDNIASNT